MNNIKLTKRLVLLIAACLLCFSTYGKRDCQLKREMAASCLILKIIQKLQIESEFDGEYRYLIAIRSKKIELLDSASKTEKRMIFYARLCAIISQVGKGCGLKKGTIVDVKISTYDDELVQLKIVKW